MAVIVKRKHWLHQIQYHKRNDQRYGSQFAHLQLWFHYKR